MRSAINRVGRPLISWTVKAPVASFSTSQNPEFLEYMKYVNKIKPEEFTQEQFREETVKLHHLAKESHPKLPKFVFGSDTGSSISPEVIAAQAYSNSVVSAFGPNPALVKKEIDAIKSLFVEPTGVRSVDEKQLENLKVFVTSSTTQANKVSVEAVGNINNLMGEIALASAHSHIFAFEVGQPAMKVEPEDKDTGKLTVKDIEKACKHYSRLGKKVKMIHLDQPTNGDFFYIPEEIKEITKWAHSRKLPVSMDVERLTNYLPKHPEYSYFQMTSESGVDVASLGKQKNGGARSSAVIVLNREFISDPDGLDQRVAAFSKCLGGVTNNETFITSGWKEMVKGKRYQENAARANANSTRIADAISKFSFSKSDFGGASNELEPKDLEMQNYPLTTNMIFAKFPRRFVDIFNKIAKEAGNDIALGPDRRGVTRIVASHDTPSSDVDNIIHLLEKAYELHSDPKFSGVKVADIIIDVKKASEVSEQHSPKLTTEEVKSIFEAMLKKSEEAILMDKSYNGIKRKLTDNERPKDPKVMADIFAKNSEGYHKPYGDDDVTIRAAEALRREFDINETCPVVFSSSKDQAITGVMEFLKATEESRIIVSEGSFDEHCRYDRPVKELELEGEFKETDKLDPNGVASLLKFHNSNRGKHVPLITAVMIEQPTSKGYVYSKDEIRKIVEVANEAGVPTVLQTSAFTYDLARTGDSYKEYATDTGVTMCTMGFQGLGGALSSAIITLKPEFLPEHIRGSIREDGIPIYDSPSRESAIPIVLGRIIKENGGRNSDSSTLNSGWEEILADDLWRKNAAKVNANVAKIKEELKGYKFDDKDLEFENINAAHNVIAVKLPKDFLRYLNEKGYEFKPDSEQYVRIQVPYTLRDDEVSKFFSDFREANQEFMDKKPHQEFADKKPFASPLLSDRLSLKEKLMQEIKEFGGVVSKEFKELAELFKSSDNDKGGR